MIVGTTPNPKRNDHLEIRSQADVRIDIRTHRHTIIYDVQFGSQKVSGECSPELLAKVLLGLPNEL